MRRTAGFTLIELMVGLTLLAMFISGVYTVAIGTLQARRRIDESAAMYTAGPKILSLIEADLRGAFIEGVADKKGFVATRDSVGGAEVTHIDLVTTTNSKTFREVDDREVRSDVTEVGYRMRRSDTESSVLELYRREQFFFDDELKKGGEYYLVYDRVRSLTMNFFENRPEGSVTSSVTETEGKETWDSEDESALPRAVHIVLTLAPPPELGRDIEQDDRSFRFERWVLLPSAFDKQPEGDDDTGPGSGPR